MTDFEYRARPSMEKHPPTILTGFTLSTVKRRCRAVRSALLRSSIQIFALWFVTKTVNGANKRTVEVTRELSAEAGQFATYGAFEPAINCWKAASNALRNAGNEA